MAITLAELALRLGCDLHGDGEVAIEGVATVQNARAGQLAFLANSRYRRYLEVTSASAVILRPADLPLCPVAALVTAQPYLAFARAATLLNPEPVQAPGIHPSAVVETGAEVDPSTVVGANVVIEQGARVAEGVVIGPGCIIGRGASIGAHSRLHANVTLYSGVRLGCEVVIHSGAVIGADGFGFAPDQGQWVKVPQLGSVVIGDRVEVGANTTIDRGALEDTVIAAGVKLDNQIQVAHNVSIGADTAIAGCVGIAGSTRIGSRCQIGGGVGIVGHLKITDDVHITAMSLVTGNINQPGLYSSGTPLEPNDEWQKNAVRFRRLDQMARKLKKLEKSLPNK